MNLAGQTRREPTPAAFLEREFPFSRSDFRKIAGIVHAEVGIRLTDTKAPLVYSRLVRRLRSLGIDSFARYCALVESREGLGERQRMLGALTTNVTRFFREPHHFEHLSAEVLPALLAAARRGDRVRIWSAGCASGEEPYSIALAILELAPDAADLDLKVLATDVNDLVLEAGEAGEYDERTLRGVPRPLLARWFVSARDEEGRRRRRVGPELRALVAFRRLNLLSAWPMTAAYQVIFCRNVLIYFDEQDQVATQKRLAAQLAPGGWLYLGAAERLRAAERLQPCGQTIFRMDGAP